MSEGVININRHFQVKSRYDVRMNNKAELVKRGISTPQKIPKYVVGKVFPDSGFGLNWVDRGDFYTFKEGGFAGGTETRAEFSARSYYEFQCLKDVLKKHANLGMSLEVGCGYGRMTPWIANLFDDAHAIEPNKEAIEDASEQYPFVDFTNTTADDLPFDDSELDTIVTWTVLQHIPPDSIERTARELQRVLKNGGILAVCEETAGDGVITWPRGVEEYTSLFSSCELVETRDREVEPTANQDGSVMVFKKRQC